MREALDDGRAPFFHEFFAAFGPSGIIPMIEMRRAGYQTFVVSASVLVLGALHQLFSGAVILPLWWTIHLLVSDFNSVSLHPHYVEGTFIGYLLGYLVVSVAQVIFQTIGIAVAWQIFPAFIVLIQALYLCFQNYARGETPDCSHDVLQLIHITNFCWSTITHAYTLFWVFSSSSLAPFDALKHVFHPAFSSSSLRPMASLSQQFLKWDILFISGTTLLVGLSLLRGTRAKLLAFSWFMLGSLCFGMGAALSGIWMWREKVLEEDRRARKLRSKEE